jgi:hypothetical protein
MKVVIVGSDLKSRYLAVKPTHGYGLGMENPGQNE